MKNKPKIEFFEVGLFKLAPEIQVFVIILRLFIDCGMCPLKIFKISKMNGRTKKLNYRGQHRTKNYLIKLTNEHADYRTVSA